MSSVAAAFGSRRFQIWLSAVSALTLVAGGIAALVVFVGNTGRSLDTPIRNEPAKVYTEPKSVALAPEVRRVAGRWILTAVRRQHLGEAWRLTAPSLKQGYTLKHWLTGSIPVVPFTYPIGLVKLKVDYSYADRALLEVVLLPKNPKVKGQYFFIGLHAFGEGPQRRWLVDYWVPRGSPHLKNTTS